MITYLLRKLPKSFIGFAVFMVLALVLYLMLRAIIKRIDKQIEDIDTEDSLSEGTEEVDENPSSSTEQPNLLLEPLWNRSKLTIINLLL